MSPFDRVLMTSYLTATETMCLLQFTRYSELFVERHQFSPTPPTSGALVGVTPLEFHEDIRRQKTRIPGQGSL